jgi:hypothetical protein
MKERLKSLYLFVQTIPDRIYPFKAEVEGKFVRGRIAYRKALDEAFLRYGPNHYGYKLIMYRGTCHVVGSIVFILTATFLSQSLFGGETALYVLMGLMIGGVLIQEFYWQPRVLGQLTHKAVVDSLSWAIPMVVYLAFFA